VSPTSAPGGGGYERLPCGCVMGTEELGPDPADRVFVYEPCSLRCEFYLYVVAETRRQGKPVRTIDTR
jgi:hypothetical protein